MEKVVTIVKRVKIQRHSRSMTIAANFQSLHNRCSSSSCLVRCVSSRSSLRISFRTTHRLLLSPPSLHAGPQPFAWTPEVVRLPPTWLRRSAKMRESTGIACLVPPPRTLSPPPPPPTHPSLPPTFEAMWFVMPQLMRTGRWRESFSMIQRAPQSVTPPPPLPPVGVAVGRLWFAVTVPAAAVRLDPSQKRDVAVDGEMKSSSSRALLSMSPRDESSRVRWSRPALTPPPPPPPPLADFDDFWRGTSSSASSWFGRRMQRARANHSQTPIFIWKHNQRGWWRTSFSYW